MCVSFSLLFILLYQKFYIILFVLVQFFSWSTKNIPIYYKKAVDVSKPYWMSFSEYALIAYKHVQQAIVVILAFIAEKLSFVSQWVGIFLNLHVTHVKFCMLHSSKPCISAFYEIKNTSTDHNVSLTLMITNPFIHQDYNLFECCLNQYILDIL